MQAAEIASCQEALLQDLVDEIYDTDTTVVADVPVGEYINFPIATDSITMYAFYVYAESHKHKICGATEGELCVHKNIATHNDIIKYTKRLATDSDLSHGGTYFLPKTDIDMGNINITVNEPLYICLNGHSLKGVSFIGVNENSKVYICNCKNDKVSLEQNALSNSLLTNADAYIYSKYDKADLKVKEFAYGNLCARELEIYNAKINPFDGYSLTASDEGIFKTNFENDKYTLSDVIIGNFVATNIFINNNLSSVVELSSVSIINNTVDKIIDNAGVFELVDTNIYQNTASSNLINAVSGKIVVDNASITNNVIPEILINLNGTNLDVTGNMSLIDNEATTLTEHTTSVYISPTSKLNIGSGKICVKSLKLDVIGASTYGLYSESEDFIILMSDTTFNVDNYFENVAISSGIGNIVMNGNFKLGNEIAENSFKASTASNVDYRAYKGTNSNVVIGIRKIIFDYNLPTGETIISGNINNINLGGKTVATISKASLKTEDNDFVGWAYNAHSETVDIEDGGLVTVDLNLNELKLYAVWRDTTIMITYHPATPTSINKKYVNQLTSKLKKSTTSIFSRKIGTISVIDTPYTIDGWTFKGWALATVSRIDADNYTLDGRFQPGSKLNYSEMYKIFADRQINLYAVWVRNTYPVILHINDVRENNGSNTASIDGFTGVTKTINMRYDSSFEEVNSEIGVWESGERTILPTSGNRQGYTFKGEWAKTKNIPIEEKSSWSETHKEDVFTKDTVYRLLDGIELYANWINNKYKITLHANDDRESNGTTRGNIITSDNKTIKYDIYYDATMSFVPTYGERTGYTYGGILESQIDTKYRKTAKTIATTNSLYKYNSDKDFYINWINKEYNLTIDLNGGKLDKLSTGDKVKVYYDEIYPFSWVEGADKVYDTLITKPTKNKNEFHFFVHNADKDKINWSELLTKEQHNNLYNTYGVKGDEIYKDEKDYTIVALYSPSSFEVEIIGNGGKINGKDTQTIEIPYSYETGYKGSKYTLPTPVKSYSKFIGWTKDSDTKVLKSTDLYNTDWFIYDSSLNKHKLTANYIESTYNVVYAMTNLPQGAKGKLPASLKNVSFNQNVVIEKGDFNLSKKDSFIGWRVANGKNKGTFYDVSSLPLTVKQLSNKDGETITLEAEFEVYSSGGRRGGGGGGGRGGGGSVNAGGGLLGYCMTILVGNIYDIVIST